MKDKRAYIFTAVIALIFLALLSASVALLAGALEKQRKEVSTKDTEYVYVYVDDTDTDTEEQEKEKKWTVREYKERIGIYDSEGTLIQIIETYVKTLPKAERDLLSEGFEVRSEKELYSVVEAYTD